MEQVVDKIVKSTEITMQNAVLVQQEIRQLRAGMKYQKEKQKTSRYFIKSSGSLTGSDGQQKAREHEELAQQVPRQRRPSTCSNCSRQDIIDCHVLIDSAVLFR